ncbi:MAG: GNAT family N-acetyltransferase [Candidatus Pacebacteria bacterium]|nr:GNAT family N-acetyltransferase [Candidatus Paceibacterota bacterium]
MNIIIKPIVVLNEKELIELFRFWSKGTQSEKHLLSETTSSLRKNILNAVAAYDKYEIVGAAGIFEARTKMKETILFNNKRVVELGSNYIQPEYRGKGLGTLLLKKRLEISLKKNWFTVSVTTNPAMQKIFTAIEGNPMDDLDAFKKLRAQLCLCTGSVHDINSCPFEKNAAWFFKKHDKDTKKCES